MGFKSQHIIERMKKKSTHCKVLISLVLLVLILAGLVAGKAYWQQKRGEDDQCLMIVNQTNTSQTSKSETSSNEIENNQTNVVENQNQDDNQNTTPSSELFASYERQAEQLLSTMTLEEKVGQMFLARYPESGVLTEIKQRNPGGYVLFGRDFKGKTKQTMLTELNQCQDASKIALLLGVDEEGGTVVRVSAYSAFRSTKFLSPQQLWAKGQLPAILKDSTEKSTLLKSIGLNMNLAPVADVPTKSSSFIYARSYGRGAEKTAIYVSELIKTMNQDGMISTMKHFPGYGDNVDTHTGIAIDERPYHTFETVDFLPFQSGIEVGAPTILISHNVVQSMDKSKPASLSEKVHQILRDELKFTGIMITDDLAMDAVKSYVENGEAAVQAVIAGNDMIISSDFVKQKQEIIRAIQQNKISEETINQAVKRILACKYAYQIIK